MRTRQRPGSRAARRAAEPRADARGRRRAMSREECLHLLRETCWGVLAVAEPTDDGAVPVGVPVSFALDGERLYLTMTEGRKLRALRRNGHLCLTATDVRSLGRWRSVAVIGRPVWLAASAERERALDAFVSQPRPEGHALSAGDAAHLARAELVRLEVDELHGFACDTGASPDATHAAARTMDGLRRLVRALRSAGAASERELGVSAAQLFVLRQLARHAPLGVTELARRTLTSQGSVSEVVARLERAGLVARTACAEDRRRAELALTEAGRALVQGASHTPQERLVDALDRLTDAQRETLAEGMEAWVAAAGMSGVAPTMFFEPE